MKYIFVLFMLMQLFSCQKESKKTSISTSNKIDFREEEIIKKQLAYGAAQYFQEAGVEMPKPEFSNDELNEVTLVASDILMKNGYKQVSDEDFKFKIKKIFNRILEMNSNNNIIYLNYFDRCSKTIIKYPNNGTDCNGTYIIKNQKMITDFYYLPELIDYEKKYPQIYDNENTESNVVYDIAILMKEAIEKQGHTVYITRSQRKTIKLSEESNFEKYLGGTATKAGAINFRSKMASTLKADYFISIHCDGWTDFSKGAHTIYNDETSKQLAIDLLDNYDITNILPKSPHKRSDLGVLGSSNKSKKKVLIELGYLTSPSDAKNIVTNKNKIATLLVNGLTKNINNA